MISNSQDRWARIRLPQELWERANIEAIRRRVSFSELIRQGLTGICSASEPEEAYDQPAFDPESLEPLPLNMDPHAEFCKMFVGRLDDCWPQFARFVNTPELITAVLENTPLWMSTAAYKGGYHAASRYLASGVWKLPPRPEL